MLSFLKDSRKLLLKAGRLCFVLGNESCDLDSAVSALALAFFYSKTKPEHCRDSVGYIPVLNISRASFPIKTEVSYFLGKHDIMEEFLVFKDDANDKLDQNYLILVDHHVSPYRKSAIEVFDHRPFDSSCELNGTCKTTIEQVGSCASLIANLILQTKGSKTEYTTALKLLYGAIVMDTVNFSPEACRKTELDSNVAIEIEYILNIPDPVKYREKIFAELVSAREDISSLTPLQLLYKDMKLVSNSSGTLRVGIPGYPISVQEFITKPFAEDSLKTFAKEQNCSVVVLIGMKIAKNSNVTRDIGLINISNESLCNEILQKLQEHENPKLQLRELSSNFLGGRFFQQENIRATRKQILPVVKKVLETKE